MEFEELCSRGHTLIPPHPVTKGGGAEATGVILTMWQADPQPAARASHGREVDTIIALSPTGQPFLRDRKAPSGRPTAQVAEFRTQNFQGRGLLGPR